MSAASAPPPNLVSNSSLEVGAAWPTCFSPAGWGSAGAWSLTAGRTDGRAVTVGITAYTSGDRKLLQTESAQCAPMVTAGKTYQMGVFYKATAPVSLSVFRHTAAGWSYWGDLAKPPASAAWAEAVVTTPPVPAGTDQISFGLSLSQNGTLTTDDYSLTATELVVAPPTNQLIVNGSLAAGGLPPTCFVTAGWGNRTIAQSTTAPPPAGSPAGTRAFSITMTNRVSGDAKLLQSDAAGCAPVVQPGKVYDVAVDFKSTVADSGLTVFRHTAAGWSYWTNISKLPASVDWTTARAKLPVIPADTDRVAFGVSIAGNGTLTTTNYSMTPAAVAPVPPPPPANVPAASGEWKISNVNLPIRAIHSTLLEDGRLLLIAGSGNEGSAFAAGTFKAVVWNPDTTVFTDVPVPHDMFCAGHVTLADGNVLVAGGTATFATAGAAPTNFTGSKKSYYFNPKDNQFHPTGDMAGAHWYPTLTKLGDGSIWSAGGIDEKGEGTVITEIFDPTANAWKAPGQVPQTWSYWGTYPHMYLLDDGAMFYSGGHTFGNGLPGTGSSLYDWKTAQMWDVPGLRQKDMRDQAGSVLLPPAQDQKVMIVGGGNTNTNIPAINLADVVDLSAVAPTYTAAPNMPGAGKLYLNLVTLPNRTVLAANGSTQNRADNVNTAAIFNPAKNAWTTIGADPVGRNYHSSAILLPDGRVVVLGSNPADNSFDLRISTYSPPYLFAGARPTVTSAAQNLGYGASFPLAVTGDVVSASLTSPMSATHQTDTNSRLVDLPIAGTGNQRVAQIPTNPNLLPPGPYMLTVLDSAGVPSKAIWVRISANGTQTALAAAAIAPDPAPAPVIVDEPVTTPAPTASITPIADAPGTTVAQPGTAPTTPPDPSASSPKVAEPTITPNATEPAVTPKLVEPTVKPKAAEPAPAPALVAPAPVVPEPAKKVTDRHLDLRDAVVSKLGDRAERSLSAAAASVTEPAKRTIDKHTGKRGPIAPPKKVKDKLTLAGGCVSEYGAAGQCLPAVPPSASAHVAKMVKAGIDPSTMTHKWQCSEVRILFKDGLIVRQASLDPQGLDRDADGVACSARD